MSPIHGHCGMHVQASKETVLVELEDLEIPCHLHVWILNARETACRCRPRHSKRKAKEEEDDAHAMKQKKIGGKRSIRSKKKKQCMCVESMKDKEWSRRKERTWSRGKTQQERQT